MLENVVRNEIIVCIDCLLAMLNVVRINFYRVVMTYPRLVI